MERGPNNDRDQVKMLHSALCSALHLKRIAEDFYGKKTQQYVKQFQQQHRLYVDGKVDRRVWQLLSKYNTSH